MYTTTTCPFCKMEKAYLNSKGIAYEEVLVDENPERAQEMIAMSGQLGVPFTVIVKENGDREQILGFDRPRLEEVLNIV